jgi:hypothetical protein
MRLLLEKASKYDHVKDWELHVPCVGQNTRRINDREHSTPISAPRAFDEPENMLSHHATLTPVSRALPGEDCYWGGGGHHCSYDTLRNYAAIYGLHPRRLDDRIRNLCANVTSVPQVELQTAITNLQAALREHTLRSAGRAISDELERLHKPHTLKIYPAVGLTSEDGHGMLYENIPAWESDVFEFLDRHVKDR